MPDTPYRPVPLRAKNGIIRANAIIDAADFERLAQWEWRLHVGGYASRSKVQSGKLHTFLLHRAVLGLTIGDGTKVDHINGNRLDDRRANLRLVTDAENGQNRTTLNRNNSSGYRGVTYFARYDNWVAHVKLNRRHHHLGYFDDPKEADAVCKAFRAEHMPFSEDAT